MWLSSKSRSWCSGGMQEQAQRLRQVLREGNRLQAGAERAREGGVDCRAEEGEGMGTKLRKGGESSAVVYHCVGPCVLISRQVQDSVCAHVDHYALEVTLERSQV